jgi:PadR family transcriptional regulator, regulatory protein AphA
MAEGESSGRKPRARAEELAAPAYVVLGMVRLGARSGYEIKRAVELSIRFFWTISQAQIYPSLEQLERAGLLRGRAEPRGRRKRRTFEITRRGEAALERWLRSDQPIPFELRDIGLVKLFFADVLAPEDARGLLESVRRRSEQRVAALREIEPMGTAAERLGNVHPLLTLRMGIAFHAAMIDVCEQFERELARAPRQSR